MHFKTMKTTILHYCLLLLCLALPAMSSRGSTQYPPGQISYQGFVTDANGFPLATNKPVNYTIYFRIYSSSSGATNSNVLWGEKQVVTVDRGYFTVMLGSGSQIAANTPFTNDLTAVFSGATASDRYVGILVQGVGNPPAEIAPRLRLLASPYSFLAHNANALVANNGAVLISSSGNAVNVNAPLTATSFVGDGSGLTSLDAGDISSGTLNKARLPALAASDIASGTFANARIPNLDAGILTTGTVSDGRLSSNVALRSGGNTFNGDQIISSGHLGLGTSSPSGQMEVRNDGNDAVLRVTSTQNNSEVIQFWRSTPLQTGWQAGSVNRDFNVSYLGNALQGGPYTNSCLTIDSTFGYVGLGTDTPAAPLHLVTTGTSGMRLAVTNHGYWDIYTDAITNLLLVSSTSAGSGHFRGTDGSYINTSDRSLKKDIKGIGSVLDRVLELRPVSFRFKTTAESVRPTLGFIAQEVEPLFPELVDTCDGIKGVAYSQFAPITVEAIQEVNARLETRLAEKNQELEEVRKQLNELRTGQKLADERYGELKRMVEKLADRK